MLWHSYYNFAYHYRYGKHCLARWPLWMHSRGITRECWIYSRDLAFFDSRENGDKSIKVNWRDLRSVTRNQFILDIGCGDGCSHPQPHPHPFNQNIRYIQNNFGCQNDFNRFIIRLRLSKLISNSFWSFSYIYFLFWTNIFGIRALLL